MKRILLIECVLAIMTGIWLFERPQPSVMIGFLLSIQGALGLCLLKPREDYTFTNRSRDILRIAVVILGVALMVGCLSVSAIPPELRPSWERSIGFWIASLLCFLSVAYMSTPSSARLSAALERKDWVILAILFVIAAIVRCWGLLTRSPIAIEDELDHFKEALSLFGGFRPNPWQTSPFAWPWLFHWVHYLSYPLFAPLIDTYAYVKLLGAFAASLSVALWFGVMRMLSTRRIAVAGALFLAFSSWHWINSRFFYLYAHDLLVVSASIFALVVGLEKKSLYAVALAGTLSGVGFITQKLGPLVAPFMVFLFLDYAFFAPKTTRRTLAMLFLVWGIFFVATYTPFIFTNIHGGWLPRQSNILQSRDQLLAPYGVSSIEAPFWIVLDAFYQLHVRAFDHLRHIFRLNGPLLDPIQSALFGIGLVSSLLSFPRSRSSRICILGLFTFIIPMALSFPIDSGAFHGLARRMLGTVFFVGWLSALGAELLCSKAFRTQHVAARMGILVIASVVFNVYTLFSSYLSPQDRTANWQEKDLGIQKSSILVTTRNLARSGHPVILLADNRSIIHLGAFLDLPNVILAQDVDQLRTLVEQKRSAPLFTVIPGDTLVTNGKYHDVPTRLNDLIPQGLWVPAAPDVHGIPTTWYNFTSGPGSR
jgi:hypothetical protein